MNQFEQIMLQQQMASQQRNMSDYLGNAFAQAAMQGIGNYQPPKMQSPAHMNPKLLLVMKG